MHPASDYPEQRSRLATLFPRGRFSEDVDGTCILRANPAHGEAHLYEIAPGRVVGLFYVGGACRYLRAAAGLILRHQAGDGEGIIHLAWDAALAARLPAFSRGRPRGLPFRAASEAVSEPAANAPTKDGSKAA